MILSRRRQSSSSDFIKEYRRYIRRPGSWNDRQKRHRKSAEGGSQQFLSLPHHLPRYRRPRIRPKSFQKIMYYSSLNDFRTATLSNLSLFASFFFPPPIPAGTNSNRLVLEKQNMTQRNSLKIAWRGNKYDFFFSTEFQSVSDEVVTVNRRYLPRIFGTRRRASGDHALSRRVAT